LALNSYSAKRQGRHAWPVGVRAAIHNQTVTNMLKKILLNAAAVMMLILAGLALGWSFTVGACNF
jgi:hypothetical protein